jgi:LCP family protein required for cell wall assembly
MSGQNEKEKKKSGKWKRGLLIALCVILVLILVIGAVATILVNRLMNQMNRVDPNKESALHPSVVDQILATDPDLETVDPDSDVSLPNISDITFPTIPEETESPDTTDPTGAPPVETVPVVRGDHLINIMLIGQDKRPGQGRQRSDSMILVTVNKSKKTITLTSFMRDQYVQIPGYLPHKLNHTYQYGGMNLLNETLLLNFGVHVDGDVEVDFNGFTKIVDLLGGVEIVLTEAEAEFMTLCCYGDFKAGKNMLDGRAAQFYSRLREIDSDYRRAERQRKVIMSIINTYKSKPVDELISIMQEVLPYVTTNMSNSEILGYALEVFPLLPEMKFDNLRIPVDGTFQQGNVVVRDGLKNWFQYNIDFVANRKVLWEVFAE